MTGKVTPIRPEPEKPAADGLDSTDLTGIQTGNEDIANSSQWVPTDVQPGRTPLPGLEHLYPYCKRMAAGRCDAAAKRVSRFYAIDPSKSLWVMA